MSNGVAESKETGRVGLQRHRCLSKDQMMVHANQKVDQNQSSILPHWSKASMGRRAD